MPNLFDSSQLINNRTLGDRISEISGVTQEMTSASANTYLNNWADHTPIYIDRAGNSVQMEMSSVSSDSFANYENIMKQVKELSDAHKDLKDENQQLKIELKALKEEVRFLMEV